MDVVSLHGLDVYNPHIDVRYHHVSAPTQWVRPKGASMVLLSWPLVTAEPRSELPDVLPLVTDMGASRLGLHHPSRSISG